MAWLPMYPAASVRLRGEGENIDETLLLTGAAAGAELAISSDWIRSSGIRPRPVTLHLKAGRRDASLSHTM